MDLEILQTMAEPGSRQLVVTSCAAGLGLVKKVWESLQVAKRLTPDYRLGVHSSPKIRDDLKVFLLKDKIFSVSAVGFPVALGLEESIRNNSPLTDSYTLEGAADIACGIAGYKIGWYLLPLIGGTFKGLYSFLHR
jgi:hypothetical protein